MKVSRCFDTASRATAVYTLVALATTWPLALHLTTAVPADLGDPLLNAFIIDWGITQLGSLLSGDFSAFSRFWHAPIFHPEPLTLAYSEHLAAQALQAAPLYAATGNILLCYNALFLSTFVLSALGMYLLARELTGSGAAGMVAGLLYGFALYRVPQYPHLQVLSSAWLPFAFWALRRYFVSRRVLMLAAAVAAMVAQNLSNGYYLVFFSPFIAAYCVYEIVVGRLWRDWRVPAAVVLAGMLAVAATVPFVLPYLELRQTGVEPRGREEVVAFSADVLAWATASDRSRVWGWLQAFDRAEGELFPGIVLPLLAGVGVGGRLRTLWRAAPAGGPRWRKAAAVVALAVALAVAAVTLSMIFTGDRRWYLHGIRISMHTAWRGVVLTALLGGVVLALSPAARTLVAGLRGSVLGFFVASAALSALLALGPEVSVAGKLHGVAGPYHWLYEHVPGFDGLRVPARYAMLTICCLSVVAAFGVRALVARGAGPAAALLAMLFLVESTSAPIELNRPLEPGRYGQTPARVGTGDQAPGIYGAVASLPPSTVVLELPLGPPAWDTQAVFYQRVHGHPIVNGYSGGFPRSYPALAAALSDIDGVTDQAWALTAASGATHVILHRAAYRRRAAARIDDWLARHGAKSVAVVGTDELFELPRR